ncbi:hypothetical protein ACWCL1_03110 [Ligilactobacillus sp. LYQ135]
MAVSSINIEKIYNLNRIPENIIKVFLVYIVFYIIFFVVVFMMQCIFGYEKIGESNKCSNQNKYYKLLSVLDIVASYIVNIMYKIIVLTTTLFTLLVIFFLAMDLIFSITTDIIVTLYKSIGVDNLDLFKALVGPIITVLVLSLSVLGSILSKSYLNKFFDDINNRIERFPEYLNRMYVFL